MPPLLPPLPPLLSSRRSRLLLLLLLLLLRACECLFPFLPSPPHEQRQANCSTDYRLDNAPLPPYGFRASFGYNTSNFGPASRTVFVDNAQQSRSPKTLEVTEDSRSSSVLCDPLHQLR